MNAMSRKINKYIFLISTLYSAIACSQQRDCNKETFFKADQKTVPKEVCIPKGYVISFVYSKHQQIDFNKDKFCDYVFAIDKKNKAVGRFLLSIFL